MKRQMLSFLVIVGLCIALTASSVRAEEEAVATGQAARKDIKEFRQTQREEIKAHFEAQKEQNKAFRASLKEMVENERVPALREHREAQAEENQSFMQEQHDAWINFLEGLDLPEDAKSDMIELAKSQHEAASEHFAKQHEENMAQIEAMAEMSPEQRREAMKHHMQTQKEENQELRKMLKEQRQDLRKSRQSGKEN